MGLRDALVPVCVRRCLGLVYHVFGGALDLCASVSGSAVSLVREVCPVPCHAAPRPRNNLILGQLKRFGQRSSHFSYLCMFSCRDHMGLP